MCMLISFLCLSQVCRHIDFRQSQKAHRIKHSHRPSSAHNSDVVGASCNLLRCPLGLVLPCPRSTWLCSHAELPVWALNASAVMCSHSLTTLTMLHYSELVYIINTTW
ncbi:hypothetical protein NP493_1216g00098 [Ridgeia piscesae]|uniref:Secreted protein n=1 Tax=Ridgeia piscesae TaxID=27915 RepID=A0AAD9NFZ0_RIDPI|nr:hypothetical protein NP493_1216g00098 [Ridgeia piscesae]